MKEFEEMDELYDTPENRYLLNEYLKIMNEVWWRQFMTGAKSRRAKLRGNLNAKKD